MENQLTFVISKNKLLKNVDILKINLSEIKGKLITVGEGEILYREGDPTNVVYLVISGEINVIKKRLLGKTKSYIFIEEDFFGNEEYNEETARTSTAVALRDSYLIALTSEEIEKLAKQNKQIDTNLHEPVEEADDDFTPYEKSDTKEENQELKITRGTGIKKNDIKEVQPFDPDILNDDTDTEFFKSIADVSMSAENNIVHPIEKIENDDAVTNSFDNISFSVDQDVNEINESKEENNFLKDNETRQSRVEPSTPVGDETIQSKDEKFTFDESFYLNEDGIPKAEFEMPDLSKIDVDSKRQSRELDDELFNILSGNQEPPIQNNNERQTREYELNQPNVEEPKDKIELNSVDTNPITEKEEKLLSDNKNETLDQDEISSFDEEVKPVEPLEEQHEDIVEDEKNEFTIEEKQTPFEPAEDDHIFAEADERLRKVEMGEPVENTDSWRTMSGEDEEEMNADQLLMIIKAAELVNSTIKIDDVLANVVDVAKSLTDADRGTLYLIDREKNELWSLVATGEENKEIRLKIGEGLAGYVAQSGEVVNIKDVQNDPRFKGDIDKASGYKTKNMLCFPIKNNKSEIIGVLQLLNSENGEFSKRDERFLKAVSIHSALALQNAAMVEKLLQSERVHSLGKMANFLIQDIKKPILVGKRYTEHLKSKNLQPDIAQVVDMLLEQLTQVADLVQTTSSYSEGKAVLRTLNVSLNNTLNDYAERISTYVESRNCKIASSFDKDVTIKLDVKEFYQCYLHIVKNACDAMPDGGNISVVTKREDRKIKISFSDKGLGIPEGFKDKIFEPFMSYGKKEGTGLGLSITKKVVEAHNGTINVQSSLGEGAVFTIILPVTAAF